jgi:hypothetical protein
VNFDAKQAEIELLQKAGHILSSGLVYELVNQGHHLTGALENSIKSEVVATENQTTNTGTMFLYGMYVNFGVAPDRIPYGGTPTGAKTSRYIQGLKSFWMLKGLSEEKALSAAFATAKKQKIEGMPTVGSYQFSDTGQRRWFILNTGGKVDLQLDQIMSDGLDGIIDTLFNETKSETI